MSDVQQAQSQTAVLTVRDALRQLVDCTDLDAELCFTFHGSDPIPVTAIEELEESQVILASG